MAIDAFGPKREDILFVPFAGWDTTGAKWFGYQHSEAIASILQSKS
jgi:hypothetical protein